MSFVTSHSASEQEDSSSHITHNPHWTTTRFISEPTSPTSEVSNLSDSLSDLTDIELDTRQSDTIVPTEHRHTPIHTSHNLRQSILFDPSSNLSLPYSTIPASTMHQTSSYIIPPLSQMPIRGSKNAPTTFRGDFNRVETFVEHYNRLLDYYHVTTEADKCRGILDYCSQEVKDYIQINPHYLTPNWSKLQDEILSAYDAERMNNRVRPKDFFKFVQQYGKGQITNLSQWKKYHRNYVAKAGFLKQNNRLTDLQYHGYYWFGIPAHLQGIFEIRLQAKNPLFDNSQPWPIQSVQEVAEAYFKRGKFTSQLPHLPSMGYDEDDEDDDSDGNNGYDSDETDDSDEERYRRKRKAKKKKKRKVRSKADSIPSHIMTEEPSRNIVPPPEEKGIESLIRNLNTMSLDDPQYGTLYYQAVTRDPSGIAAQCITRKPKQIISVHTSQSPSLRDPPPHQYPSTPAQQTYPNGILPRQPGMQFNSKCFGCFETNHSLRDCPKMAELRNQGIVTQDPQSLKYRMPNGQPLYRKPDESLVDTVTRMTNPPAPQVTVSFATIKGDVDDSYKKASRRSYLQYSLSDEDDDADEYEDNYETEYEEDDEFEEGHWKRRLDQRFQQFPTYAAIEVYDEDDEVAYEAYPAERTDKGKTTRQARDSAMNNPIKRAQLDGIYMPPKRFTRSTAKPSDTVPSLPTNMEASKSLEEIIPVIEPIPVDARKPRFKENPDQIMDEPEPTSKQLQEEKKKVTLQEYVNRTKSTESKKLEPIPEHIRTGPRQSDLSVQVDSKEVVKQILDTPVSISIGKLLGTSRDLSNIVNDMIRYKNPTIPHQVPHHIPNKVYNTRMEQEDEQYFHETARKKEVNVNRMLIQIKLYCNGNLIYALIDTGSQLNVASRSIAEKQIRLPIDISKEITMNDVNGHSGKLRGMIKSVPLCCGSVLTEATEVYVADNLPCDLLLGRPWQRGNLVSIDERTEGTYLVFKDHKTAHPRYEIFIAPEHLVSEKFQPYRKAEVYTAINAAEPESSSEYELEDMTEPMSHETQANTLDQIENFYLSQSNITNGITEDWSQITSYINTELSNHKLFKIPLFFKNTLVTTIVDTGSQTNLINQNLIERLFQLPINNERQILIYDKDGEQIHIIGSIKHVPLTCGVVDTIVEEIFVSKDNLPFDLLLGNPWQKRHIPMIEEHKDGTYLKIQSTTDFCSEILIAPKYLNTSENSLYAQTIENKSQTNSEEDTDSDMPELVPLQDSIIISDTSSEQDIPNWIITYGPFMSPDKTIQFSDFDYYIYLHELSIPITDNKLQIGFGNLPFRRIELFDIAGSFVSTCERLSKSNFLFLVQILKFYQTLYQDYSGEKLYIPENLQINPLYPIYTAQEAKNSVYDVTRFEYLDEIIQLATVIIRRLQRNLIEILCQKYPDEASEIFTSQFTLRTAEDLKEETTYSSNLKLELEEKQQITSHLHQHTGETNLKNGQEDIFEVNLNVHNLYVKSLEEGDTKTSKTSEIPIGLEENISGKLILYNFPNPNWSQLSKIISCDNCLIQILGTSQQQVTDPDISGAPEKENQDELAIICPHGCTGHKLRTCDSKTESQDTSEQDPINPKMQNFEVEPLIQREAIRGETSFKNSFQIEEPQPDNDLNTTKDIETNPHPHSLTMETYPGPYQPPTDSPMHPYLPIPMYEVYSTAAIEHGKEIFNMTDYNYDPSPPLSLSSNKAIVTTNRIVQEESVLPFACAELVTPSMQLQFSHNGTPYTLNGDAYIQFTYFTGDSEALQFHNAFNTHPPTASDEFIATASEFDVTSIATDHSEVISESDKNRTDSEHPENRTIGEANRTTSIADKSNQDLSLTVNAFHSSSPSHSFPTLANDRPLDGSPGTLIHQRVQQVRSCKDPEPENQTVEVFFAGAVAGPLTPVSVFRPTFPSPL
jgi:hypothetical protein